MDDRQLALILAAHSTAGKGWVTGDILKRAEAFHAWLIKPEDPPDVSWVETGPITERPPRDIQDTQLP